MTAIAPAPVQPNERIAAIDILRAFALLGILVMNMPGFFTTFWSAEMPHVRWPAWHDRAAISVMEFLFLELMLWGKEQGYERFTLGMVPLAGLERRPAIARVEVGERHFAARPGALQTQRGVEREQRVAQTRGGDRMITSAAEVTGKPRRIATRRSGGNLPGRERARQ